VWLLGDEREVLVTDAPHDAAAVAEAVGNRRVVALACTHANADHLRVAPALAICSTPVIFRSRLHQVRGKYRWCIGLLTACLSEVGCTELHLVQESWALLTGAVSRSRAWAPFA